MSTRYQEIYFENQLAMKNKATNPFQNQFRECFNLSKWKTKTLEHHYTWKYINNVLEITRWDQTSDFTTPTIRTKQETQKPIYKFEHQQS